MSQDSSVTQSRVSRFRSATGLVLTQGLLTRKRMWVGPALTAVVIAVVGWMTHRSVEDAVKTNLAEQLSTLLDADVAALEFWLSGQRANVIALAGDDRVTGTPLYMSPEAIQQEELDVRSDLYAVGTVGYFLLTGTTVFDGKSIVDICKQHLEATPQRPSERFGKPLDDRLEEFILRCLAKRPDDRPASAELCEEELLGCQSASRWTQVQAKAWWAEHLPVNPLAGDTAVDSHNVTATIDVTMDAQIPTE